MSDRCLKSDYILKLRRMSEDEYLKESEDKIWLSAFAGNNPRSCYHWMVECLYDEAKRRKKPDLYKRAFEQVERSLFWY